ncbi:ABC transporter substrate-binding protein [Pseudonocardia nigra]|uniref:ABC transporter substrate-binding protein n=1 Tax=Pseudonocardia nigra TaxID=1921578 RepID=UPI001C5E1D23|nr:ABC transporter substrate-binding protein [Pseudonocardia nigra]
MRSAGIAAGALALALVASGCGGSTSIGANPNEGADGTGEVTGNVRVAWWGSGPRNELTNAVIDQFTAAHPGTTVEGESADFGAYFERLNVQASSGNLPCVTQLQGRQLNDYTTKNVLLDLQPMIDSGAIDVSEIPDEVLDTGRGLDGTLYMIPYGAAYDAMVVNRTLAEAAGVGLPAEGYDWAAFGDWLAAAEPGLPEGIPPVNLGGALPNNFISYVAGRGETLFEDRQLGFSQDLLVEYWDMWEQWRQAGLTTTAEANAEEPEQTEQRYVAQGKVLADNLPGNALTPAQKTLDGLAPGQQLASLPLPSGPAGSGNVLFTSGFSIPTSCANVPTAAAFIDFWINDDEAAATFLSNNGAVTNSRQLQQQLDNPELPPLKRAELDLYQKIVAGTPVAVVYPPGYQASFEGAFTRAYESVIFGGTSTQDAAAAFFTEVNTALESR